MTKQAHLFQSMTYSLFASVTIAALLLLAYFAAEPSITRAQLADTSNDFVISQTITDESSFLVQPANVTMDGSLNGISGGTANGSTTFSVQSNNSSGYTVSISFFDNGTEGAMLGSETADESIRDFQDGITEPVFAFTASSAAQFGYTVESLTPGDTDASFLDDGASNCASGATQTADSCWMAPTSTSFQIVDRDASASTGATSTLKFRVVVPNNPNPVPTAETYYATATLSLFNK